MGQFAKIELRYTYYSDVHADIALKLCDCKVSVSDLTVSALADYWRDWICRIAQSGFCELIGEFDPSTRLIGLGKADIKLVRRPEIEGGVVVAPVPGLCLVVLHVVQPYFSQWVTHHTGTEKF